MQSSDDKRSRIRRNLEGESNLRLLKLLGLSAKSGLTPEGRAVAEDLLGERGVAIPDMASCPRCQVKMVAGEIVVKGNMRSFLLVGFSHQQLMFEWGPKNKQAILGPHARREALRCEACGILVAQT